MVKKYVLKVGKRGSEVHVYPTRHSGGSDIRERKWYWLKSRLRDIGKGFNAIAVESNRSEAERVKMREALREEKKFYLMKKYSPIVEKCKENNLNLVFIDSQMESMDIFEDMYTSKDSRIEHEVAGNLEKLPRRWRKLLKSSASFRSLIMASNLRQAVKLHEKYNEGPVKIAVIANKRHVKEIRKLLSNPEEFKEIKGIVRKLTKGEYGVAKWKGLVLLKPENLAIEGEGNAKTS